MYESPRIRRLRNDLTAMERLAAESSVMRFRATGKPAQQFNVQFRGKSLARERGKVTVHDRHDVEIRLGASYPRTMPEIRWLTPIYHPNISEIGMVCLGGYGTHWVPSLTLDDLCGMLWDMARFQNYDIRSPYNREAALWVANQTTFLFPLDPRPLRDLRAALGRVSEPAPSAPLAAPPTTPPALPSASPAAGSGAKAGKYAEFVRKFAADLDAITSRTSSSGAAASPRANEGEPESYIILDMEVNFLPERPRARPDDEIVFID